MPNCIRSEVGLLLDQRICVLIAVKKIIMASLGSLLVFSTALKQDTFGAYDQNYIFAQPAVQTTS